MLEIGRIHTLKIKDSDERGLWLQEGGDRVLLPRKEAPAAKPGESLKVFVYRDAAGSNLATVKLPQAQLGEFALLQVGQVTKHGAFLDWGPDKQLLVPFAEQPVKMLEGRKYLVKVCRDGGGRLVGTARIDRCLETEEIALADGEEVELILWQFTDLGAKMIVNDLYCGLLYKEELRGGLKRGDRLKGYVKHVREDRKIDVTLRRVGQEGIDEAKEAILAALQKSGFLHLHDRSTPGQIKAALGMSKKAFKKALGGLYKEGLVELAEDGVRLKKS